jgi:hypothetical protein
MQRLMRVVTRILSSALKRQLGVVGCPLSGCYCSVLPACGPYLELLLRPGTSDDSSCSGRFVPAMLLAFQQKLVGYQDVEESRPPLE